MATRSKLELIIGTATDVMVDKLIRDYDATYEWALAFVLGSATYQRMLSDKHFRCESPLYIYQFLQKELSRIKSLAGYWLDTGSHEEYHEANELI